MYKNLDSNNENDKVLSLWNEMQDGHIFPSEKIKNMIDSLLQTQKQQNQQNQQKQQKQLKQKQQSRKQKQSAL